MQDMEGLGIRGRPSLQSYRFKEDATATSIILTIFASVGDNQVLMARCLEVVMSMYATLNRRHQHG